jgi:uncharacterized membrane protein (DUF4010 family)
MNEALVTDVGLEFFRDFATAIGLGLLMGLERERNPSNRAGLRTFGLVSLLGTVIALLADRMHSPWLLAAGLLVVGTMMVAAYLSRPDPDDPGTTSVIALLLCYCYGAMIWFGYQTQAVMLGISTTVLLYFKTELKSISQQLSRRDLISILQFCVLSMVILPILPAVDFGPYNALNPRQIWWMVVLISGFSLAGYAALRFVGQRTGAALLGFFGGLVSSTATTLVFSRHARANPLLVRLALVVVLTANLVVLFRLAAYAGVLQPTLLPLMMPVLAGGALTGIIVIVVAWRGLQPAEEIPEINYTNPAEIRTALTFGSIYGIVLLLSAVLSDYAGSSGLYVVSLISGLTDVDAITLSSLRLYGLAKIGASEAAISIIIALYANLAFKLGIIAVVARGLLARWCAGGFAAIALGSFGGWLLF